MLVLVDILLAALLIAVVMHGLRPTFEASFESLKGIFAKEERQKPSSFGLAVFFLLWLGLTTEQGEAQTGWHGRGEHERVLARIGSLEKSVGKLDARVGGLEVVIEEQFKHFEKHLEKMESSLTAKLNKIDEDIRGNGKDGMNIRLDRLENSKKLVNHYYWIIVAAAVPALISIYLS